MQFNSFTCLESSYFTPPSISRTENIGNKTTATDQERRDGRRMEKLNIRKYKVIHKEVRRISAQTVNNE